MLQRRLTRFLIHPRGYLLRLLRVEESTEIPMLAVRASDQKVLVNPDFVETQTDDQLADLLEHAWGHVYVLRCKELARIIIKARA